MDEFHTLIAQNRIEEAIAYLKNMANKKGDSASLTQVTMIDGRLSDLKTQQIMGIITHDQQMQEKAKITYSLMQLYDGLINYISTRTDSVGKEENLKPVQNNSSNGKPQVYLSYGWGDDEDELGRNREILVNWLYTYLMKGKNEWGFEVFRDKKEVSYGDSIGDFMDSIGKADLILVFLSKKYLYSEYCMFELSEIARHCSYEKNIFREKIIPIYVEDINWRNTKMILEFNKHWVNLRAEVKELIDELNKIGNPSEGDTARYKRVETISGNLGKFKDFLSDIAVKKLQGEEDFEIIKDLIVTRLNLEV